MRYSSSTTFQGQPFLHGIGAFDASCGMQRYASWCLDHVLSIFLTSVPLTKVLVRESTRDQMDTKIVLRRDLAEKIQADTNLRVMIYCASDPLSPFSFTDIAFPHQVEFKVNEDEVKANTRGLKNKPGSTRPADITKLLRIRAEYSNVMKVTYALTNKVSIVLFRNSFSFAERYKISSSCSSSFEILMHDRS